MLWLSHSSIQKDESYPYQIEGLETAVKIKDAHAQSLSGDKNSMSKYL